MTVKSPTKPGGRSVSMSNAVVQSGQQLTLLQKRLVMMAVARLNPRAKGFPDRPIRITAEEYAETFGVSPKSAYDDLKRASDSILSRYITLHRKGDRGLEVVSKYPWLSRADYASGEGWVALKFNPEIEPHLVDLKKRFTTYKLDQAHGLRSVYSWRLLEHFEMHSRSGKDGWWQVSLEDFHAMMETPVSYQSNFAQVKRFVIEPAIKELTEKDNWLVEWNPIKRGRKTTAIRFNFRRDQQGRLL